MRKLTEKPFCISLLIEESDKIITKGKAMSVAAISPMILMAAAIAREFWASFIIVGFLAIAYLVVEQEKEMIALKK